MFQAREMCGMVSQAGVLGKVSSWKKRPTEVRVPLDFTDVILNFTQRVAPAQVTSPRTKLQMAEWNMGRT